MGDQLTQSLILSRVWGFSYSQAQFLLVHTDSYCEYLISGLYHKNYPTCGRYHYYNENVFLHK